MIITADQWQKELANVKYLASNNICLALQIATTLEKPLLIEGPPGVGKTLLSKAVADIVQAKLIRLQCYEGITSSSALYEYNYGKQLMYINILKDHLKEMLGKATIKESINIIEKDAPFWGDEFLVKRPILEAINPGDDTPRVLLIDEIDRSEREFEALLLESLSDFSISIPEYGTITATKKPLVFLTSNRTRELSEALRRRCIYIYIDYPTVNEEMKIIMETVPGAGEGFAKRVATIIAMYRKGSPKHLPSIAETIDLASILLSAAGEDFSNSDVASYASVIVKNKDDMRLLDKAISS